MRNKVFTGIIVLLLLNLTGAGQVFADDIMLINEHAKPVNSRNHYYQRSRNDQHLIKTHRQSTIAKYNPVTLILKSSMYVYQNVLSPQLARSCPYGITCSNFSKQSITKFGIIKGVFLSADRIMRCNRIGVLDVHPLDINEKNGTITDPPNKYQ